jgi:colicin import membrane protein
MKSKILVISYFLFFLVIQNAHPQSKKELYEIIGRLQQENKALTEQYSNLKQEIAELKELILSNQAQLTQLRSEIAANSSQTTKQTEEKTGGGRCQAITAKGTQCTRQADPGSNYCWQHKSTYEPKSSEKKPVTTSSGSSTSSSGRTIYTGPRGGQYYINSKGNKVYIKHK